MMYGKMGTLAVHEVAGDCPLLISEESMTRLGAVRLRAKRIDIEDLEIASEELEFHPRSGHPIVRLLPTTKNATARAACEDQFVGQIEIDMPEDSDSGLDEVHFVGPLNTKFVDALRASRTRRPRSSRSRSRGGQRSWRFSHGRWH